MVEGNTLLHGEETVAYGDAGYQGIEKRPDAKGDVTWHLKFDTSCTQVVDLYEPKSGS